MNPNRLAALAIAYGFAFLMVAIALWILLGAVGLYIERTGG